MKIAIKLNAIFAKMRLIFNRQPTAMRHNLNMNKTMKTKTILMINSKGGCGKSTLATNLASYYALWNVSVALVDYDPQHSSLDWLKQRQEKGDDSIARIQAIDASNSQRGINIDSGVQRIILDSPARIDRQQMKRLFEFTDYVLIPVLPSPIDIRAGGHFIGELMLGGFLKQAKVGLVANRVRENNLVFHNLEVFLKSLKIPLITSLRDTQNYIRAADDVRGIFEMPRHQVSEDVEQWRPIINWLEK